jgi:hypothetical protein
VEHLQEVIAWVENETGRLPKGISPEAVQIVFDLAMDGRLSNKKDITQIVCFVASFAESLTCDQIKKADGRAEQLAAVLATSQTLKTLKITNSNDICFSATKLQIINNYPQNLNLKSASKFERIFSISCSRASRVLDLTSIHVYFIKCHSFSIRFNSGL